ncbi:hypothetical protein C1H46_019164 [Malus baccata]|uniref:Protein kinase domain-containing protein n=1 Tax=Malus baccata TaxID=106549 RepID=A0A540M9L0_MALBA|nr:hypothetical protein C1H46_019164 [Malus baccata]
MWYFFAIQRMMICWHAACRKDDGCDNRIFSCHDHHAFRNTTILNDLCSVSVDPSDTMLFDFGIFAIVLQSGIVGSTNYFQKFLKCFWWGLQNLSSLGSNLETSIDGWENLFTVFISIIGLLMFLYLIGNLQMYMQFKTSRTENLKHKMKMKRKRKEKSREIDLLLFKNGISTRRIKDMKLQIMEKVQEGIEAYMDTKWDNVIPLLPSEIQSVMRKSLSMTMLKEVQMLKGMDEGVLQKLHQQLEPVKYTDEKDPNIIQKGQPLDKMLFIVDGHVSIENSQRGPGGLCGEELLRWPFYASFPHKKPLAAESVKAVGVVEALALKACILENMRAFQNMEESVLKEICRNLQPMYYDTEGNVIKHGDPIQMFYIMDGTIGHKGWEKNAGEFYGEELLVWPFMISFPNTEPKAAESLFALTDVEALVLTAKDMKKVASEFRKHFIKNYGRLAKNLVNYVSLVGTTPWSSSSEAVVKFFTEEELKEATENYTCYNYANEGGYGTVYEATLHGRRVAIKTCNSTTDDQYIQSQRLVQEAFVLSQIRHKNVVRLLGCCLEAKWPIMVYHRTYSSTLFNHMHINEPKLSLELRLNIAAESARALAYLHFRSVIHRDVKTANILIDNATYTARVSGFGASRLLHEDELSTLPVTSEYLDPEYLKSVLTAKSDDVYSFGVVLVELLKCQQAVSSDRPERSLANVFVCSVQEDHLDQILDGNVIKDKLTSETAKEVSELAVRCLSSREKERPSMEEVAEELEGLANYYTVESKTGFSPPRS